MKDRDGCSTCPKGQEQWETFHVGSQHNIQYEYRDWDGALFSTVTNNIHAARQQRDIWLKNKETNLK